MYKTILDLCFGEEEGIDCLPNEEIFAELSRMCLVRNVDSSMKFYMYPRFLQLMIRAQGRKRISGVDTPLFEGMIVAQQVDESADEVNVDDVPAVGVANEGAGNVNVDVVLTAADEPIISSLTPTTPPPPSQDVPSTSQDAKISMDLLYNLLDTCTTLTRRVENLEQDKIAQALEITKLKQRVKKLERRNKLKVSKLRRLKKVGTTQRVNTSDDIVMGDVSKQGRIIASMDADVDVTLKDVANIAKEVAVDTDIEESVDIQGRQAESQAQIYQIDLEHADKVLSFQDDELEPAELQEVMKVATTAKLMTEVVTVGSATITDTDTPIPAAIISAAALTLTTAPSATRRRKGVVIRDPEETATPSTIIHSEAKSKDKGKGILVEEHKPFKKQAQIEQDEAYAREGSHKLKAQARKNMMIYLRNMAGFKMDYFKGMKYDDIRPIFEKYFNSNVAFLEKTREQMEEEDRKALKRISESQEVKAAKK
uniref:Uncharacterized protein n=1 Tax=Tanacetum cinerariifolium TaxID=118510 RepID=A0A6L2KKU4_TANCI|nr:hypothetical protein [Tanacetum cinerariifolium]